MMIKRLLGAFIFACCATAAMAQGSLYPPHYFLGGPSSGSSSTFPLPRQIIYGDLPFLGTMSEQSASAVAITGGTITGMPTPTNPSDVAIKSYVDAVAIGLIIHTEVSWATTVALPNSPTYNNGTSGIGATLTAGANAAIVVDGSNPLFGDRVLVKNQSAAAQNGVYTVTTVGSGSAAWVMTRATDFDVATAGNVAAGAYFFVYEGVTNIASSWVFTTTGAITIGTTGLSFDQYAGPGSGPWGISGNNITSNNSGYVAVAGGSFFIENVSSVSTPVSGTYFYGFSNAGTAFIGEYNYSTSTYLPVTIGNSAISIASGGVATTIPTLYAYTAPGTGGQTNTVQTTTQRVLYLSDFTTVQEAITEAQSIGVKLVCDAGYNMPSGGVTISASLVFEGIVGACELIGYTGSVGLTINTTAPIVLRNIPVYFSALNASNVAFLITAPSGSNTNSIFDNIATNANAQIGLEFANANAWSLTNSKILGNGAGMIVENTVNADQGDSYAGGNLFESTTGGVAVEWASSGGFKFIGNKINGTAMSYGFLVALASGATTGDLFIEDNSIEGVSTSGSGIGMIRQGSTGAMGTVNIANNELIGFICLYIPTDANGVWLGVVSISGNNCLITGTGGAAYSIDSTTGFNISGGVSQGVAAASRNIAIGPAASVCSLGPVVRYGSFSNSSLPGSCSTVGSY